MDDSELSVSCRALCIQKESGGMDSIKTWTLVTLPTLVSRLLGLDAGPSGHWSLSVTARLKIVSHETA